MAKQEKKKKEYFKLPDDWEIEKARSTDYGIFFTLKLPGLSLYNLKIVYSEEYGEFIGMPSVAYQKKKGKKTETAYASCFNLYLNDEDKKAIIEAVEEEIEE